MNSFYLASAILRGKWLIEPNFAESQGAIISNYINKYTDFKAEDPDPLSAFAVSPQAITGVRHSWYSGFDKAKPGSIAVIRMHGSLMKFDQSCGPLGTDSIGQIIKDADSHHNIDGIVLHIDSPGGTVDGTEALGNIVKNAQKPVVTFVDGLMASAALWIGSAANEIIASTDTDEIGSVGVLLSFADVQPYWEQMGIKFHTIPATTSPDKVQMWEDIRAGKYDQYKKDVLDPLDEKFMNTIRENLPNVKDEHLTGKVFFARDVMDVFVNSIGTLEDAILRASELAEEQNNSQGTNGSQANSNNQKNMSKKYLKIQGALGSEEGLELEADGSRTFSEEEMDTVENALAENNSEELQANLDTATQTVTEHETTIATRDARITELEAENATLRAGSAGGSEEARTDTDEDVKPPKEGPVSEKSKNLSEGIDAVSQEYLGKSITD